MTAKLSTGLRNKILDTGSLKSRLALGFLKIYSGAEPATADAAVTGTLLTTISVGGTGTGLSLDAAAVGGVIAKSSEVWSGPIVATGVAGYFRFVAAGDTGASSLTEERAQGSVGLAGADLNLSSTSLAINAALSAQTINYFVVTIPAQA
jgi:hypothetical protein